MAIKLSNTNSDLVLKKGTDCEYNILVNPGAEMTGLLINPKVHTDQNWAHLGIPVSGLDTNSEFDVVFNTNSIEGKVNQDLSKTVIEWLISLKKPSEKTEKEPGPTVVPEVVSPPKDPTG